MNALGQLEVLRYEWQGGLVAKLDYGMLCDLSILKPLRAGAKISVGSLRLKVLSYDTNTRSVEVVRDNWLWIVLHSLHTSSRLLDLIYRRFIITLVVWNLAYYSPYTLPTYKDIKLINWLLDSVSGKYQRAKCYLFHRKHWDYQTFGGKDFHHAYICLNCEEVWPDYN